MTDHRMMSSRISGFYRRTVRQRVAALIETGLLSDDSRERLLAGGGLEVSVADRMSENVIATLGLPFAVALNFRVNHRDVLVPMAVEEPSIVAAASNAARLARISGGFSGESSRPIMTAQIQLDSVPNTDTVCARVEALKRPLLESGNAVMPGMVSRGGGCVDLDVRVLDAREGLVVVHVYVDVGDAMGANLIDSVAEALAPKLSDVLGGCIGLRILSNLPLRRMVKVTTRVSVDALGGMDAAVAIGKASRFAELDPFRAVTHNKGVMNGIDAVAVALGQDWRAIEAGAHAYASISGRYVPLATWHVAGQELLGVLEMPLAAATIGGSTRAHQMVRAAFELVRVENARELAVVMGAAGLASNLAALKALTGEGIQRGHMRLHRRKEDNDSNPEVFLDRGGAG